MVEGAPHTAKTTVNLCVLGCPPPHVYKGGRGRPAGPPWRAPKRGILLGLHVLEGFHQKGERECIFIPLKIAKRKRCKNAVGGVIHEAIQIAAESNLSTEQRCLHVHYMFSPVTSLVP